MLVAFFFQNRIRQIQEKNTRLSTVKESDKTETNPFFGFLPTDHHLHQQHSLRTIEPFSFSSRAADEDDESDGPGSGRSRVHQEHRKIRSTSMIENDEGKKADKQMQVLIAFCEPSSFADKWTCIGMWRTPPGVSTYPCFFVLQFNFMTNLIRLSFLALHSGCSVFGRVF